METFSGGILSLIFGPHSISISSDLTEQNQSMLQDILPELSLTYGSRSLQSQ